MPNRNITTEIWNDPQIVDDFTAEDMYVWLYILTSPHTNLCGVMKSSITTISIETKMDISEIKSSIVKLKDKHKLIDYDADNKEILILNWHKHNWTKSSKLITKLKNLIESIKTERFKKYLNEIIDKYEDEIPY